MKTKKPRKKKKLKPKKTKKGQAKTPIKISKEAKDLFKKMQATYDKKLKELEKEKIGAGKAAEIYKKTSGRKTFVQGVEESYKEMEKEKRAKKWLEDIRTGRIPPPPTKVIHFVWGREVDSKGRMVGLTKKELLAKWKRKLKAGKMDELMTKLQYKFGLLGGMSVPQESPETRETPEGYVRSEYKIPGGVAYAFLYIKEFPIECEKPFGESHVVRGSRRIEIPEGNFDENKNAFRIQDGDRIITGKNSYLTVREEWLPDGHPEATNITLLPNSELRIVSVRKHTKTMSPTIKHEFWVIHKFELIRGLFCVGTKTDRELSEKLAIPGYSEIEFKPMYGEFGKSKDMLCYIELNKDGSLTIFSTSNTIIHKGTKIKVRPTDFGKITVTRSAVYGTNLQKNPDPRVKAVTEMTGPFGGGGKPHQYQNWKLLEEQTPQKKSYLDTKRIIDAKGRSHPQKLINQREELKENLKWARESGEPELIKEYEKGLEDFNKFYPDLDARTRTRKPIIKLEKEFKQSLKKAIEDGDFNSIKYYVGLLHNLEDPLLEALAPTVEAGFKTFEHTMKQMKEKWGSLSSLKSDLERPPPPYNPVSESDRIKLKKVTRTTKSQDQLMDQYAEDLKSMTEKEAYKRLLDRTRESGKHKEVTAQTGAAKLSGSASYQGIEFQLAKVEKGTELSGSKAPAGMEYLMIYFKASNRDRKQAFFDPSSIVSILYKGELIPLRNYRMETSLDPGTSCEGQFFFLVPEEAKKFVLQFGKKAERKKELEIKV